MIKISKILENSLWDCDFKKLNYGDEIVVLKALNFGEIEDVKNIEKHIGREELIKIFKKKLNEIDNKSRNFWRLYFNIKNLNITNTTMYDKLNKPIFTRSFGG